MDWRSECAAVIPCLNEAREIAAVVEGVRRHVSTVLVVDDGSIDGTTEAAKGAGGQVLRHETTQGKGAALCTGWRRAREQGFKWAVCLDGDGQHSSDDIPLFFVCAERIGAPLVIGNRMEAASQMPWVRRAVNRWMSRRISNLAARTLPDSQCGFRLMNLDVWAGLTIRAAHFEIESEVLLAFIRAGLRVEFVPIRAIYKNEQSKIHPLRDSWRWWHWWRSAARQRCPASGHVRLGG